MSASSENEKVKGLRISGGDIEIFRYYLYYTIFLFFYFFFDILLYEIKKGTQRSTQR